MAIIQVNHQVLRKTAEAIETYCDTQVQEMRQVDTEVKNMLRTDWIGPDAMEFGGKWENVDDNNSVSKKFLESMRSYSKALKSSANAYQDAQEKAYNLSALLPR